MTDQELFEKLKREGECWKLGDAQTIHCRGVEIETGEVSTCCITKDPQELNPDFSTWKGFGWLWERMQEHERCEEFWDMVYEEAGIKYKKSTDGRFPLEHNTFWMDYFAGIFCKERSLIHPTRFRDALKKFFQLEPVEP